MLLFATAIAAARQGVALPCDSCIMLILSFRRRFSLALYSRPIRLSEDGYVAAACHGLLFTHAAVHAYVRLVVAHRHKVRQAPQGLENMKFAIESTGCENDVLTKSIEGCTEPSLLNSSNR